MRQFMFSAMSHVVCLVETQRRIDVEVGVGLQVMTDPAHPHSSHGTNLRALGQHGARRVDEVGIDSVQQPAEHISRSDHQHDTDGACDEKTDDGVDHRKAKSHAASARHHRQ